MTDLPAAAITAAYAAVGNREPIPSPATMKRILEAAAPILVADALKAAAKETFEDAIRAAADEAITPKLEAIRDAAAAAERERIRQLAIKRGARSGEVCQLHGTTHYRENFADLLRGDTP